MLPRLTLLDCYCTGRDVERKVISRVAAVSGDENPQVTRWLQPDFLTYVFCARGVDITSPSTDDNIGRVLTAKHTSDM